MRLNPFKDSNLNDLQSDVFGFFSDKFGGVREDFAAWWGRFKKKGNERVTIMFIPHSEKKIINFHISIFAISGIGAVLAVIIFITSLLIFSHASNVKEVSRLKLYGSDSKVQIGYYKDGDSGDLRLSPAGIIFRNKLGDTTVAMDVETGDAIFAGQLQSGTLITGTVEVGDGSIQIDGEAHRMLWFDSNGTPSIFIGLVS